MGDVEVGCILELGESGTLFVAERGRGLEPSPVLSPTTTLERMFWTYGLRGRPTRALMEVLAEIVDASSVGGASFDLGSATFDMTRVVTGQLDAYIEPGPRIIDDVPGMRAEFERIGGGAVLNNSPYDLAAAVLCLEEGGAVVTDAYGKSVADRPLLGSSHEFQISCIAVLERGSAHRDLPRRRRRHRAARRNRVAFPLVFVSLASHLQRQGSRASGGAARLEVPRRLRAHRRPRRGRRDPRARGGPEGQEGPPRQRDRLRRRRLGDPLHAGPPDARRRARHALADHHGPRGVLQRDEAPPQLPAGRPEHPHPRTSGSCSTTTTG